MVWQHLFALKGGYTFIAMFTYACRRYAFPGSEHNADFKLNHKLLMLQL